MSKGIFGWSLPPGVSLRDIDPPEAPCAVCGNDEPKCICPECPECGWNGHPQCYADRNDAPSIYPADFANYPHHGLRRSVAQIESLKANEAAWAEVVCQEADYEGRL